MSDASRLAPAEKQAIGLGYLRLTDSAPLIMAREQGFFEKYGLQVSLQREVSWANLRDRVVAGDLDAAQMLAPLPLTTTLGAGGMRADLITGLALSLNGNAITLGEPLATEIEARAGDARTDAAATARAMGEYLRDGSHPVTLAAAHTFSCHILQLRHWLRVGGADPARDVNIIVLPPEQMVDSLSRGVINGFCVGEPWNTIAVQHGVGAVQATGYQVWNNGLEKVLAVTESWHRKHPGTHLRLRLALMEACAWLAEPHHRMRAAEVLADRRYLDLPLESLLPSLTGHLVCRKGEHSREMPHFHIFGRFQAGFPWRSDGEWLLGQVGTLLGRSFGPDEAKSLVQRTFRTDLYREAARHLSLGCPSRDYKPLDVHDEPWEIEPGIELGPDRLLSAPAAQ